MSDEIKSGDEVVATPAAAAHAEATGVDLTTLEGSGAGGKIIKADVEAAAAETAPEAEATTAAPADAGPPRFRHANGRTAIVDDVLHRFFVWAGLAEDAEALVEQINADHASAERFTWTGGAPAAPAAAAAPAAEE